MVGLCRCIFLIIATVMSCKVVLAKPVHAARLKNPKLMKYFRRYGYLPEPTKLPWKVSRDRPSTDSDAEFEKAVRKLQGTMNRPVTGQMSDEEVLKIINQKRCGVQDFHQGIKRTRRFSVHGTSWKSTDLTYKIEDFTSDLKKEEVERTIEKALEMWSNVSRLTFTRVTSRHVEADITIKFVVGYHGDSRPTDGPGKELAHSFFPLNNTGLAGDLHFDDDETYNVNGGDGVDLLWLAVHELGHSLGLEHVFHPDSVMFPFYTGYNKNFELDVDDIDGIQHLYGRPSAITRPTTSPTQTTQAPKPVPDICSVQSIDTVVMTKDLKGYVFSGAYFWRRRSHGGSKAMRIRDHWAGLEDDIDAAFTRRQDGKTFFFKGSKYWVFSNTALLEGPLDIAQLNLPSQLNNIDAAFELSTDDNTYFFKGDKYWRYNWTNKCLDPGYPKMIRLFWKGLPSDIDAGFQWKRGRMAVVKGGNYYGLRQRGSGGLKIGQPRNFFQRFMGCPAGPFWLTSTD